ncbi:Uncharacterised protein, partial [Mycoplasmoides gallisepticum]
MTLSGVDFDEAKSLLKQKELVKKYKNLKKFDQYQFVLDLSQTFVFKKW